MSIQIINPLERPGWDDLLLSCPGYSFFHCAAWARSLHETYYYTPSYFTILNNGQLRALIPVMEVNSFFTGKRGVSLPFTDYCDFIVNDEKDFRLVWDYAVEYGREKGWKYLDLRNGQNLLGYSPKRLTFIRHNLDLSENENDLFSAFRGSTRRNIKKAIREKVDAQISHSLDSLREFYKLNLMTRKKHGLPPQPFSFFEKLYQYIISRNHGFVVLASFNGENIAGAVYFHFGNKAVFKYGASDEKYRHLRPNNLVMWEAIRWYSQNGFKSLCLGRTEPENRGLIRFKSGWGAKEEQINYYRYDFEKDAFISEMSKPRRMPNRILRNMPISLLKGIGEVLYRHAG